MGSCGLDVLSKLAEWTSLDALREDFPRKSDEGLSPAEKRIGHKQLDKPATSGGASSGHGELLMSDTAGKVAQVFKQMDVRGDGEVCWEDFSSYMLQMELLHETRGAAENEHYFKPLAAHLGFDGNARGRGVSRLEYLPAPIEKLGLIGEQNEVVHLIGHGSLEDDDKAPFRVESGGGSELARITSSLRHDTAYKPHQVNAVHSIPNEDVVITSSSLGPSGPHVLTVWDLPTEVERSSEKQFLPALTYRQETPTRQTVIFWAPTLEMVLTGCSENGSLLGWDLHPLQQSAKIWLHNAGITHVHELVGRTGGAPHVVTASVDGTIAVSGGTTRGGRTAPVGDGVLQRLQAHERGVAHMAFSLHYSLALSAGVFVNAVETASDVLAWKLDRDGGMLEQGIHRRLKGHEGQVVGLAFIEEEREVVTGSTDATFLVWHVPSLVLKQRFTRSSSSPVADQPISIFSVVPKTGNRPYLLVAGMSETGALEIFARVKKTVHEALIKAEFCPYLQRFVTISARRATVWDGKTGEAITTLASKRLLGNEEADITAFSLDHQGHKLVVGADTGEIRVCLSHSGSLIRRLDPHNGPVNGLSFASRKSDKCIFSIGGDGALNVLDDADATGYIKPSTPSQTSTRRPPSSQGFTRAARWEGDAPPLQRPARGTGWGADSPPSSQRPTRGRRWREDAINGRPCSRSSSTVPSTAEQRPRRSSATVHHGELNNRVSNYEARTRHGERRPATSEAADRAKHEKCVHHENDYHAELSNAGGKGGAGRGEGRRSVLLRQVVFASSSSDGEEEERGEGNEHGVKGMDVTPNPKAPGLKAAPNGVGFARKHRPAASSLGGEEPTPPYTTKPEHADPRAKGSILMNSAGDGRGEGIRAGSRDGPQAFSENNSIGLHQQGSTLDTPGRTSANSDSMQDEHTSSHAGGRYAGGSSAPSSNVRLKFARVAQTLLPFQARDPAPGKSTPAAKKEDIPQDSLFGNSMTYDITAYAADDHLNLISTATTSDGGVESINSATAVVAAAAAAHRFDNTETTASEGERGQQPPSSVHLWDAERMSLVGTLLFPNPALTSDLGKLSAKQAFHACHFHPEGSSTLHTSSDPAIGTQQAPTAKAAEGGTGSAPGISDTDSSVQLSPTSSPDDTGRTPGTVGYDGPSSAEKAVSVPAAIDSGTTGLSRPTLVTALAFLSPYPLLAGASTVGTVALWRVPNGVCVQAIVLSADLPLPRRRRSVNSPRAGTFQSDAEHFTCLARGKYTPTGGEETTVIYVGTGRGDVMAAHLSLSDLVTLSGDAKGPVLCQRRANHNPNRAVRFKLTPRAANSSLRDARHAQEAHGAGETGSAAAGVGGRKSRAFTAGPRDTSAGRPSTASGTYNFAVPSSTFTLAWVAHAATVSSISWIESPPSLLSASADGLAKIWAPDGSTLLGQLDINTKRPEISLSNEGRQWAFSPGTVIDQRDELEPTLDTSRPTGVAKNPTGKSTPCGVGSGPRRYERGGRDSSSGGDEEFLGELGADDVGLDGVKAGAPGEASARAGLKGRRGRPRRQHLHQHVDEGPKRAHEGRECHSPESTTRFPTSTAGRKGISRTARASTAPSHETNDEVVGGLKTRSALRAVTWTVSDESKIMASSESAVHGDRGRTAWMSGWDGMTRQLKAFEEKLEASSSGRRIKNDASNVGRSLPTTATSTGKGGRKVPLHGKRWRTMSAPSADEGNAHGSFVAEDSLHPGREAGSIRIGIRKGMKGYVAPRPGTAEDAAVKRLAIKGATGVVTKDKTIGRPRNQVPSGRPLDRSLARPPTDYFPGSKRGDKLVLMTTTNHAGADATLTPNAIGGTTQSLPPAAILAGSSGGRLVSSGIAIVGDRERGGFNVEVARATAREVLVKETTANKLTNDEDRQGSDWKVMGGPCQRKRNEGQGGRVTDNVGAHSWGWDQEKARPSRKPLVGHPAGGGMSSAGRRQQASTPTRDGYVSTGVNHKYGGGGSSFPAPPCGGVSSDSVASGCGSSGIGTESASGRNAIAGGTVGIPHKEQGLSADSVRWWSSTQTSGPSDLYRAQRGATTVGQGETIRTLVHMGLL